MARREIEGSFSRSNLDEQVLTLLRQSFGEHLSGSSLSHRLSVSRSTLCKQVGELCQQGYEIEVHPRLGYRLISSPDLLLPQEIQHGLKTTAMGHRVFSYQRVGSTNDVALQIARNGAAQGTLVVAEEQTAGRGRMGRSWNSPPGVSLLFSLVLRPRMAPNRVFQLAICGALAVAEVVCQRTHLPVKVKWPNDVLIRGKKLAGVLTETQVDLAGVRFVVLGVGININQAPTDFPEGLQGQATSIRAELGRSVSRRHLLQDLLLKFEEIYDQFQDQGLAPFLDRWRQLSWVLNRKVTVQVGGKEFSGLAVDIDEMGALLLEEASGKRRRLLAGDVSLR
ncbi:biotin--[acetyl-CoA-carboxylase] ligase [bacterium]|nr:biotin--[acetyl-CoA-carboxylase] ligase [bacterium]